MIKYLHVSNTVYTVTICFKKLNTTVQRIMIPTDWSICVVLVPNADIFASILRSASIISLSLTKKNSSCSCCAIGNAYFDCDKLDVIKSSSQNSMDLFRRFCWCKVSKAPIRCLENASVQHVGVLWGHLTFQGIAKDSLKRCVYWDWIVYWLHAYLMLL